jgi:hypothetical protein
MDRQFWAWYSLWDAQEWHTSTFYESSPQPTADWSLFILISFIAVHHRRSEAKKKVAVVDLQSCWLPVFFVSVVEPEEDGRSGGGIELLIFTKPKTRFI